jgi:hypothetical protein
MAKCEADLVLIIQPLVQPRRKLTHPFPPPSICGPIIQCPSSTPIRIHNRSTASSAAVFRSQNGR